MNSELNTEVMVTCAVTGGGDTVGKHPAIPVTPEQIANAAIEAAKAGAAIAHCHVRDPETGKNSMRKELFAEVAERVRSADTDVILNLTGGNGGHYIPSANDPRVADPSSDLCTPEERAAHAVEIKPEICSFDVGAVMFGSQGAYLGTVDYMRDIAKLLKAAGVKPELEAFDSSGVMVARQHIDEGLIDSPPMMLALRDMLPPESHWWAFGISRLQMPMAAKSVVLGGNVRVGLEDNLYLSRGVFASNGHLVEKAAGIVENLGCRVLTPAEARVKLGLPAQ